jgi:hypothetical protein
MLAGDRAKDCPPGACLARSCRDAPVGNGRGNPKVDFRSRSRLAPEVKVAAQLFCALAHSNQAEVPGFTPVFEHRGVDTLPIVAAECGTYINTMEVSSGRSLFSQPSGHTARLGTGSAAVGRLSRACSASCKRPSKQCRSASSLPASTRTGTTHSSPSALLRTASK